MSNATAGSATSRDSNSSELEVLILLSGSKVITHGVGHGGAVVLGPFTNEGEANAAAKIAMHSTAGAVGYLIRSAG